MTAATLPPRRRLEKQTTRLAGVAHQVGDLAEKLKDAQEFNDLRQERYQAMETTLTNVEAALWAICPLANEVTGIDGALGGVIVLADLIHQNVARVNRGEG